jgi:competence protein ComEA
MKLSHRLVVRLAVRMVIAAVALAAFPVPPAGAAEAAKRVVNVNSADSAQLALLPRVGPSVAQRIVEHRKANGPFKKVEDLMLVRGIGEKMFALLKPHVALAGETTLKEKVRASRTAPSGDGR